MTVQEVLKQSGMSDEQIKALDAAVVSGFETVLSTATKAETEAAAAREAAEIAKRAQEQLFAEQISPALDSWASEKAAKDAEVAFYRTQLESARSSGFIPKDAPGYVPPNANLNPGSPNMPTHDPNNGRFVPNTNPVPGSPSFMTPQQTFAAVSNATWLVNEHMRLHGQPLPDEIETVLKEANDRRLGFREYAEQKYKFNDRRTEISNKKLQETIDAKVKEGMAAREKELAERYGNNPNLRQPITSNFADVAAAVQSGQRKDPLTLTEQQRREQTRDYIMNGITQNAAGVNG